MHVFFFRYIYKCEGMYVCIYICNFGYADWGTLIEVHPIVSRKLQGVPFVGERLLWLCCSVRHVLLSTSARQDLRARVMKSDNFLGKLVRSKKQQPSVFLAILIDGTLLNMSSFSLLNVNVYLDKIYCWLRAVVPMIAFENQVFSITFPTEKVRI